MRGQFPTRFLKDVYPALYRSWTEAGFECPRPEQLGQGRYWKEFWVKKVRVNVAHYMKRGDYYFREWDGSIRHDVV